GLGRQILDLLKADFVTNNKTGCRFITVDAYNNPKTLGFYGRNGFEYLDETDSNKKTRLMFFDLAVFVRGGRGNLGHQEPGQ
ncbi:MAG: hypothetical protein KDK33_21150, partial [Leptospiraceae bacterium]|nr:hypothetical protein [Leptospiraceae bacterium]